MQCPRCQAALSTAEVACYGGICELCSTTPTTTLHDGRVIAVNTGESGRKPFRFRKSTLGESVAHQRGYHGDTRDH